MLMFSEALFAQGQLEKPKVKEQCITLTKMLQELLFLKYEEEFVKEKIIQNDNDIINTKILIFILQKNVKIYYETFS